MSSVTSSNADLNMGKLGDSDNGRNSQGNLKDRFKMLRMKEEAGIVMPEMSTPSGSAGTGILGGILARSTSNGGDVGSPHSSSGDGRDESPHMARSGSNPGTPAIVRQPTINTNLPPGTAAGMASAPPITAVDWDLWQSVVYEGPAAVARTSPEELTQAIAGGIPQAIRGVVWQVLAKSKNEDLEALYHELVARGTDKEKDLPSRPSSDSTKESNASSASSIRSGHSTPASTVQPSVNEESLSIAASLSRIRSAKDDPAKITKLEKTIKRDLGARTSFSKYVMSAGLQDGLFGICKAYALYDEAVGYAQGMNFIAMPLLFNVRTKYQRTTSYPRY